MSTRAALLPVLLAAAFALPARALAVPSVRILDPAPGGCVSADAPAQIAIAGAEPPPLPADVALTLEISESQARPVTAVVTMGGLEVAREVFVPGAPGVPEAVVLRVPAQAVDDGAGRVFDIEVTSAGGEDTAQVTATVDRRPPRVVFQPADLARMGECIVGQPAAVPFQVEDTLDPNPASSAANVTAGCEVRYEVTARDHCGDTPNEVVVRFGRRRAPPVAPTVTFAGVAEGELTLQATVDYTVTADEGCTESVTATLQRDAEAPGFLLDGAIISDPGQYTASVAVDPVCSDQVVRATRRFTVVSGPQADAGGPYRTAQGEVVTLDARGSVAPPQAGAIVSYDWDLDNDGFYDRPNAGPQVPFSRNVQGTYQVWVRITTATGLRDFDDAEVTVTDPTPTCDAGGPYEVEQGAALTIDGSGTRPGSALEPILAYGWDFGDNRFPQRGDGLTQPVHRYEQEGEYTITLTAQDIDSSCTDTAEVTVRDIEPVIRNLHVVDVGAVEGQEIRFSAGQTSAGSASEPLVELAWDFGDGSPPVRGPELRGPTHTYREDGTYRVCLTATDLDSEVSECLDAVVGDLSPFAELSGPAFALEGETVAFDAAGSRAGGAADALTRLRFDFSDGTPETAQAPGQTRVEHTFTRSGELTVTLTVEDEDSSATASRRIVIEDAEPLADLVLPAAGVEGQALRLDASASVGGAASDPITIYRWDFGDGETAEGPDLATVDHAFPDDGIYLVAVTVEDADGSQARRDGIVRVSNAAPADVSLVRTTAGTPEVGRPVGFELRYRDVPADAVSATWTFGDGGRLDGPLTAEHTFETPGRYRVVALLDDGDGGEASAELFVQVERRGPDISGPTADEATEGQPWQAQLDVLPAPDGAGGFDAPLTVRVPLLPPGATFEVRDGPGSPLAKRVILRWTPAYAQEGLHRLHVDVRSAAGLQRGHDLLLTVADAGTPVLVGVNGAGRGGESSVFAWRRDPLTRATVFERRGRAALGETPAQVLSGTDARHAFVSLATTGRIGVVDTESGALVRRIPLAADGRPPVLVRNGEEMWVIGPANGLYRLDEGRLKLLRQGSLEASVRLTAAVVAGDFLAALGGGTSQLFLWDARALGAAQARPPKVVPLPFRPAFLAPGPEVGSLVIGDAKAPVLHTYTAAALEAVDTAAQDAPLALPGLPRDASVADRTLWISTTAGVVTVAGQEPVTVWSSRAWAGFAALPATLLGEAALALGTESAVEVLRTADQAVLETWRGNGASRLSWGLRR